LPKRRLYDESVSVTLAGSAPFYVKSARPVQKGWVRYVTSASIVDRNQTNRSFALGKLIGKIFIQMEAEYHCTVNIGMFTRNTHHFIADEYPVWYCVDSAAANVIDVYFEGYEVEIENQE
jgi:hypothetical protein